MILGQLRIGERHTTSAALFVACIASKAMESVVEQETEKFSSFLWLPSILSNNSISFALKCLAFGEQDKAKVFNGRFRRAYKSKSASQERRKVWEQVKVFE